MRASRRGAAPTGRRARTVRSIALAVGLPALAIGGLSLPSTAAAADESAGEPADRPGSAGVPALDRPRVGEDRDVRQVRISAVTADRFATLRRFAVETCAQVRVGPRCAGANGRWTRIYTSPAGAFTASRPRPVRPDLGFGDFDVPDRRATHLRLVVLDTQCTGNPAYRGEQEADPLATSNCLASAEVGDVAVAELMVYGADRHTRHAPTRSAVWN